MQIKAHPCCLPAAGCWFLATGCWLLAAGCWLLAAGCQVLAAGCLNVRQCLGAAPAMQRSSQVRRAPMFGSRQGYAQKLSSTTCASVWELPWLRPEALKYDVRQCLGALMATPRSSEVRRAPMFGSRPSHAKKLSSTTCASVWEPPGLRPEALEYDVRQRLGAPMATPRRSQVRRAPVFGSRQGRAQKPSSTTCASVWELRGQCPAALKYGKNNKKSSDSKPAWI
jgi:hypothetical protein